MSQEKKSTMLRQPAEVQFARELVALASQDKSPKPEGWRLSPQAVRTFINGSGDEELDHTWNGKPAQTIITRKFYGDNTLIERCIVTLIGNRGLLLVGEPGTAKSMLSELLAAAISGVSTNTIQGTAGITEDQIKYSWNYALLLTEGPGLKSLVPSPIYRGMKTGCLVRFEEITRCQPEIQDSLVSLLSDKVMQIPELGGEEAVLFARKGFNIVATANIRDRGVHEMSSALKRRFNFETVNPIASKELELKLVREQTEMLLKDAGVKVECPMDVIDLLVTTFQDLRTGNTEEGKVVDKPSTVMSTAEAVSVGFSAALDAFYFGDARIQGTHIARQLIGTILKDNPEDIKKLKQYFDVVVKTRAKTHEVWKEFHEAQKVRKGL